MNSPESRIETGFAILEAEDAKTSKTAMRELVRGSKCGCPVCIRAVELVRGRRQ